MIPMIGSPVFLSNTPIRIVTQGKPVLILPSFSPFFPPINSAVESAKINKDNYFNMINSICLD